MEYSAEQWARMRENAMRTAFEMQRRARAANPAGQPQFFRASYGTERYTAPQTAKPSRTVAAAAGGQGSRASAQAARVAPTNYGSGAAAAPNHGSAKPEGSRGAYSPGANTLTRQAARQGEALLLSLILLLWQEGADSTLIALLLYILF
jgi:hypothetical protein